MARAKKMKKRMRVRFVWYSGTEKYLVIAGKAGRYRSVDSAGKALSAARKMIRPCRPRRFCFTCCVGSPAEKSVVPMATSSR